eukprot:762419-Hanusia_phi.AAC.1
MVVVVVVMIMIIEVVMMMINDDDDDDDDDDDCFTPESDSAVHAIALVLNNSTELFCASDEDMARSLCFTPEPGAKYWTVTSPFRM